MSGGEGVILTLQFLTILGVVAAGAIAKRHMGSYLDEKGKNLATKEDVGAITNLVKAVERQHLEQLETFRVELTRVLPLRDVNFKMQLELVDELIPRLSAVHNSLVDWSTRGLYANAAERFKSATAELQPVFEKGVALLPVAVTNAISTYKSSVLPFDVRLHRDSNDQPTQEDMTQIQSVITKAYWDILITIRKELRVDALGGAAQQGLALPRLRYTTLRDYLDLPPNPEAPLPTRQS